jgi:hypothetical protein
MAKEILGNFYLPSDMDASQISSFMDEDLFVIDEETGKITLKGSENAKPGQAFGKDTDGSFKFISQTGSSSGSISVIHSQTLNKDNWILSNEDNLYHYVFKSEAIDENTMVEINPMINSLKTILESNILPTTICENNQVTIFSVSQPIEDIEVDFYLYKIN